MNDLLQKHGCSNVFSVPEGLKELMSDISREVLRDQPPNINDYISNYLSVLLITREHGIMAVKILDDLCDCRPSVSEHLIQLGLQEGEAQILSEIIKKEIEGFQPSEEKETIKEYEIMKKILIKIPLDEEMSAKVCQVARNAFRDYWYRKKTLEKLKIKPKEPWEVAAQRTLELYKRTKPSMSELARATERIQAAYRGYHVRRNLLRHLKPKSRRKGPKVDLPGPPLDIAAAREIDLGPLLDIDVREDDINAMFDEHVTEKLGLQYDPMKAITHVPEDEYIEEIDVTAPRDKPSKASRISSQIPITTSQMGPRQSRVPSAVPSRVQSVAPSRAPSVVPSRAPSVVPSQVPSVIPSRAPSVIPSRAPSVIPSRAPSIVPSRAPSAIPSQLSEGKRQSRLPSQVSQDARRSRVASRADDAGETQKISFSNVPPEIFTDEVAEVEEGDEIKEVLPAEAIEAVETDALEAEVPEDVTDDHTEATDGEEGDESAPAETVASSAPDTANTTDVEDEAAEDFTTDEEEG